MRKHCSIPQLMVIIEPNRSDLFFGVMTSRMRRTRLAIAPVGGNFGKGTGIMKSHCLARTCTVLLCLGVVLWSGCANFLIPEAGALARKEARILLVDSGVKERILATNDLKITYSFAGGDDGFTLSGRLVFDRSVSDSFPVISRFFLNMSFLDGQGRVIETVDITPVFHTFGSVPEKLDFNLSRVPPAGSKAIAFSYFGEFRSNPPDMSGTWDIYSFPFD